MVAGKRGRNCHRGKMETIASLLELMPCKKSQLMFKGRLNHGRLEEYLEILKSKKLCEFKISERIYFRTELGNTYLCFARQLASILDEQGKERAWQALPAISYMRMPGTTPIS